MIGSIKKYLVSYNLAYWISLFTIILLSLALYVSSNVSKTLENQMTQDTISGSEEVKNTLFSIKEEFDVYHIMLNQIANRNYEDPTEYNWLDATDSQFTILLKGFASFHPDVSGYFRNVLDPSSAHPLIQTYTDCGTFKRTHISVLMDTLYIDGQGGLNSQLRDRKEPFFTTLSNTITETLELLYVAPLYIDDEYRGFFGIVIDANSLKQLFGEDSGAGRQVTLLTKDLEILATTVDFPVGARLEGISKGTFLPLADKIHDETGDSGSVALRYGGKDRMNVFVKLPSGQIFWESYLLSEWSGRTNALIAILSISAILCIWMVQKRNGVSPFDKLAYLVFGKAVLPETEEISHKASFGTHIGLAGASFTLFLFTLLSNNSMLQKAGSAMVFIIVAGYILRFKKSGFSNLYKYLYLAFCLFVPVIFHHLAGGFAAQNGGVLITFCVLTLTISSFFLDDEQNRSVFALFVMVLFLDAALEMVLIPNTDPRVVVRFMTVIFFLGFALFISTDLYVASAKDFLSKLNDAYSTLKNTQSQLVKEEKMVVLGRLIAGIAHEINTPLGAIKASAEGMEESLEKAFAALMEHNLNETDRMLFFRLMTLTNESMADMYTTMQIRRAKPQIRAFFEELGYEDPDLAVEKLVRLEICNLEAIKENRDIFESPNIIELLNLLIATGAIVKGSYIILQSTEKTYKIIFALKSYSHTNVSSDSILYNITQSVDNVLVLMHNQLKRSVEVVRHYDENIPELLGKPDELGQVWINLIQNAVYAMGEGGVLTIGIHNEGEWVHVSISDNGAGIAPEVLQHVFEPFYTTKSIGEGSGLGLDICNKIIEGHRGRMEVESQVGVYTTFHIRIPVSGGI